MFLHLSVILLTGGGSMCGCSGGDRMVAWGVGVCGCSGGACVVALGGMHGCSGGVHGCWGVCMVALGDMRGCSRGACMVALGGHAWLLGGGMLGIRQDTEIRSMSGRYAFLFSISSRFWRKLCRISG